MSSASESGPLPEEGWERAWQAGETPWDHGAPAPPLLEYLEQNPPPAGDVLVPGCGSGHDARALAAAGARVLGLDIAPSAIRAARAHPPVSDERYAVGDLLALAPQRRGAFDWVFEHTCLCALEPQRREAYAEAVTTALKPGGRLLGIFFVDVGKRDGDGPPHPIDTAALDRLFAGKLVTEQQWRPGRVFDSRLDGEEHMRVLRKPGS